MSEPKQRKCRPPKIFTHKNYYSEKSIFPSTKGEQDVPRISTYIKGINYENEKTVCCNR